MSGAYGAEAGAGWGTVRAAGLSTGCARGAARQFPSLSACHLAALVEEHWTLDGAHAVGALSSLRKLSTLRRDLRGWRRGWEDGAFPSRRPSTEGSREALPRLAAAPRSAQPGRHLDSSGVAPTLGFDLRRGSSCGPRIPASCPSNATSSAARRLPRLGLAPAGFGRRFDNAVLAVTVSESPWPACAVGSRTPGCPESCVTNSRPSRLLRTRTRPYALCSFGVPAPRSLPPSLPHLSPSPLHLTSSFETNPAPPPPTKRAERESWAARAGWGEPLGQERACGSGPEGEAGRPGPTRPGV